MRVIGIDACWCGEPTCHWLYEKDNPHPRPQARSSPPPEKVDDGYVELSPSFFEQNDRELSENYGPIVNKVLGY